ncbi:N-acetylneuraminate synthase family protein [Sphingomonas sp. CFBP 13728]|uniref:N-acetylneuraminate synthase family protein n=1 Tax=Sphingomonas sp. CFBP 13728 TaxID=2775294 RepID=UPI0017834E18|nr:N-acetylneuraminate synthase family protein [Sphingomonas sp. CFBP 13728]MBD8620617.1 N-acetylneuraminate synthase family protein [Sphingomonas sp. CFBP 13728]
MQIGDRVIGPEHRPYVIAEVAQAHEGSLGNAMAFVDAAEAAGADAVKFQTHIADEESTPHEPWRVAFSRQDASRYDYWKRMEFSFDQWATLKSHCDARGITFLSSPFSLKACDWLERFGMPAWKVASGEINNDELLGRIMATGQPVILSTGLATPDQAIATTRRVQANGNAVALLHCTTRYPTPAEEVGLNIVSDFRAALPDVPIGLSDHSGTPHPAVIATYLGAAIIEVHLTLHKGLFGPDISSSLTPDDLRRLVDGIDMAWRMRQHPVDKDRQLGGLGKELSIFGRSLYTAVAVPNGTRISTDMLVYKKPGGGLSYADRNALIGRTAVGDLPVHHLLDISDVV